MNKFGIIGFPLRHTLSPSVWNLYFKKKKIKALYEKIETPPYKVPYFNDYTGLNVTTPWKEEILKYVDKLDLLVIQVKNANTILIRSDKKIRAFNTDYYGFEKLMEGLNIDAKNVVILGTGGAAKTCAIYFRNKGVANLCFLSRRRCGKIFNYRIVKYEDKETEQLLRSATVIVNATPCGWKGELPPIDFSQVKRAFLIDLQYSKASPFLKTGGKFGLEGIDGRKMLLYQAIGAGKIWFHDFDEECFKECFHEVMEANDDA